MQYHRTTPAHAPEDLSADLLAEFPPEVRDACTGLPPLVKMSTVTEWASYSVPGLYKAMSRGSFPRPMKLGPNRIAWSRIDLARWLADCIQRRQAAKDAAAQRAEAGL